MVPVDGSADEQEILYGLHAVREALRAGNRPLQRLLVVRTDKQFFDLVQLGTLPTDPDLRSTLGLP